MTANQPGRKAEAHQKERAGTDRHQPTNETTPDDSSTVEQVRETRRDDPVAGWHALAARARIVQARKRGKREGR